MVLSPFFRRRKNHAPAAMTMSPPRPTPTPIPALAPVESPLELFAGIRDGWAGTGLGLEVAVELELELLATEEVGEELGLELELDSPEDVEKSDRDSPDVFVHQ